MSLADYHRLVGTLVRGRRELPAGVGDPLVYASLVRLQHKQPLVQVYGALRGRRFADRPDSAAPADSDAPADSAARVDALFEAYLDASPPREAHPGWWAVGFADFLAEREDLPLALREGADYLALRLSQSLCADESLLGQTTLGHGTLGHGTRGEVRAYAYDPRRTEPSGPVVLLVFRARDGALVTIEANAAMVGAWGLACGECDAAQLAARGLSESLLVAARQRLREAGHPLF